ncbi:MAG TPA: alpha/beta hydrolase-fold protein, partial [Bryobacteraceae bacterium]|nr:alpha/beta hydrolase-fold protein [Bryobacteraceae bacterium]
MAPRAKEDGRLRRHPRFPSRYLSTPRDLIVYLPPGYAESAAAYPVLYLQDGQNLFDAATAFLGNEWRADLTADDLIRRCRVEPLIIVGLYNTGVRRISEYTPTRDRRLRKGGKAERYAQMLVREVKPFIDHQYRTRRGPADTGVGGSSLGALVSLVTGLAYPRVFGKLALMSPSVWWDEHSILALIETRRLPQRPRIWLDTGTAEGNDPAKVVADAHLMRDALAARGWREGLDLHYEEARGHAHNE